MSQQPPDGAALRRRARRVAEKAIGALEGLLDSEHPLVVLKAASALLDRGYGRPSSGPDEEVVPEDLRTRPVAEQIRWIEERMGREERALEALRARRAAELAGAHGADADSGEPGRLVQ